VRLETYDERLGDVEHPPANMTTLRRGKNNGAQKQSRSSERDFKNVKPNRSGSKMSCVITRACT
jgi:hypothetical protein